LFASSLIKLFISPLIKDTSKDWSNEEVSDEKIEGRSTDAEVKAERMETLEDDIESVDKEDEFFAARNLFRNVASLLNRLTPLVHASSSSLTQNVSETRIPSEIVTPHLSEISISKTNEAHITF
jgi:hypothetical protein